jgi:bifunctional DNA-binding transcriptional regulator/antitoxin component of YhaV-PrlF toxin-antitoxin module
MDMLKPTEKPRKITGKKFTLTVPLNWRNSHKLKPGDTLDVYYGEGGVIIQSPTGKEISDVEKALIQLLVCYPEIRKSKELAQMLVDTGTRILSEG